MQYQSFCAANSGKGFISFFDSILDEKNKMVYYIKGGPGCGKSTLMRRIAEKAENAELILCSGDPDSLDGLILPRENAVIIDATAPHSHEPIYPGIGGNIIDLGIGWQPEKLNKKKIIHLCEEKGKAYKSCYKILSSAKALQEGVFFPLKNQIPFQKIAMIGDKILKQNALWEHHTEKATIDKRFLSGISPHGRITHSETFEKIGKNIILLEDRWLQSSYLLGYIEQNLKEREIPHINGYHPLFGEPFLQHLIIPKANLSIITKDGLFPIEIDGENIIKTISMQNLISKEHLSLHKNKLSFMKRLLRELLDLAGESLKHARDLHQKIEEEYAKGYSFEAAEDLKIKLMNNLFG